MRQCAGSRKPYGFDGYQKTPRISKQGNGHLIQGGAGGVAGFAVQLAKYLGAKVITTASAGNHDYVRGLGADQSSITTKGGLHTAIGPICDVVFDTVGGACAPAASAQVGRQPCDRAGTGRRHAPTSNLKARCQTAIARI